MKCEVVVQDAENAMIQSKPTKQVHVESITHGKGSAGEIFCVVFVSMRMYVFQAGWVVVVVR